MRGVTSLLALAGMSLLGTWIAGRIYAQGSAEPVKSARGGILVNAEHLQFEVFFTTTGLRVFVNDSSGAPVNTSRLSGKATFYHPKSTNAWFSRSLRSAQGGASLDVTIGLKNVPPSSAKVTFEVSGLPNAVEPTATFTVPFEFYAVPSPAPAPSAMASRYVYRAGPEGYGYYSNAPNPGYSTSSPAGSYGAGQRDWTTGRDNLPISKPWLRPMD